MAASALLAPEERLSDTLDVRTLRFERGPKWLRLFVGDERCYWHVKARLADPLNTPDRYVSIVDGKDREILLLDSLDGLDAESRAPVEEELADFYAVPRIRQVLSLALHQGPLYWEVVTDRGPREFVLHWNSENIVELPDGRMRLMDVDGNRFQIDAVEGLDEDSRKRVALLQ